MVNTYLYSDKYHNVFEPFTTPADRLRFGATTGVAIDAWFDDLKLNSQSMPQAFVPQTSASLLTSVFEQLWRWLRSWFSQPEATALLSEPPTGRVWRSYYFVGSQRIALREQTSADPTGQVSYLLSDHLGSTTLLVNPNGVPLPPPQQYTSWGATRPGSGEVATAYQYTGQRNTGLGIYYYGARFYDSYLNRFLSPDTIVPDPYNPLDWDRYSYGRNNPVNNTDPTGHKACERRTGYDCDWKTEYLWSRSEKILARWGGVNDLLAMKKIVNTGARVYNDFDSLIPALSEVFLGSSKTGPGALIGAVQAGGCGGVGREPRDCEGNTSYFTDKGFHSDFRDRHNQIYHVWGYIAETSAPGNPLAGIAGQITGTAGNIFHEVIQSIVGIDEGWGTSWQDYVLSEKGMQIGALITDQTITPSELASVLYDSLSDTGPGSGGRLQELQDKFPALRGDPR